MIATNYPNRDKLDNALNNSYLRAMRRFMMKVLQDIPDSEKKDPIIDEASIDFNKVPSLIKAHWTGHFAQQFKDNREVWSRTGIINEVRNIVAHIGKSDIDIDTTRACLHSIAVVLEWIDAEEEKGTVLNIYNELISNNIEPSTSPDAQLHAESGAKLDKEKQPTTTSLSENKSKTTVAAKVAQVEPEFTSMLRVAEDNKNIAQQQNTDKQIIPSRNITDLTLDPWEDYVQEHPEGSIVQGIVTNNKDDFGAFVQLKESVHGMIHKSELAWKRIEHPGEVVSIGDKIEVEIIEVDREKRQISLTLKRWDRLAQRYPIGSKITVRVKNFKPYGAFVEIKEGIDGMIHQSDISWTEPNAVPSDTFNIDDEIEAVVLEVSETEKRISLGTKYLYPKPSNSQNISHNNIQADIR